MVRLPFAREVWGSISGPVKSDSVPNGFTSLRCFCVALALIPATCKTLGRNPASIKKV